MKTLKTQFSMNELPYILLKRNDVVALYGIGGTNTDKILHYEADIIYIRKDKYCDNTQCNQNFYCFHNQQILSNERSL